MDFMTRFMIFFCMFDREIWHLGFYYRNNLCCIMRHLSYSYSNFRTLSPEIPNNKFLYQILCIRIRYSTSLTSDDDKLRKFNYELRIISCLWTILKIDCVLTGIYFLDGMSGKVHCLVKFVIPYPTSWYKFEIFGLDYKFLGCFSKSLYSWSQLSEEFDFNVRLLWDEFWTKNTWPANV